MGNSLFTTFEEGWTVPVPEDDIPSCDGSEGPCLGTTVNFAGDMQHNTHFCILQEPEHILDFTSPFAHGSRCLSLLIEPTFIASTSLDYLESGTRDMNYYEYASTTD